MISVVVAHVEKDVRMVERRQRADALELARADLDHRHARIVVEMGNDVVGHDLLKLLTSGSCSRAAP